LQRPENERDEKMKLDKLKKSFIKDRLTRKMLTLNFDERMLEVNEVRMLLTVFSSMVKAWAKLTPHEIDSLVNKTGDYKAVTKKWMDIADQPFTKDISSVLDEINDIAEKKVGEK
jgi:hypothetical protein